MLNLADRTSEIAEVRRVLAAKRSIGPTSRLAVLNVGQARETVRLGSSDRSVLSIRHEPEAEIGCLHDASHSGIYGVPEDDNTIPELIAGAVLELHTAR